MRKQLFAFIFFLLAGILFSASSIFAQSAEEIRSFESAATIRKDGTVKVVETIQYDFSYQKRHGIFRNIPYIITNQDGKKYAMDIAIQSVTDEKGLLYKYNVSTNGDYVQAKIGDPDRTISGIHTYKITYEIRGALRYFSDHDELYWNVTGNEWTVPIANATYTIIPEFDSPLSSENLVCYTGYQGGTDQNCAITTENGITVTTTTPLQTLQGLTVAYRFPKDLVAVLEPREYKTFWETLAGKITIILLVLCALWWYIGYPISIAIKWFLYGRDPNVGKPVTSWFDPPVTSKGRKLTPAETGTIIDEKVQMRDIAAMMVDLARRGYYTIEEKEKKDFYLHKKQGPDSKLEEYEKYFMQKLFASKDSVRIKDVKLATTVQKITKDMYEILVKEDYFPENPEKIRAFYGVMMGMAGMTFNLPLLLSGAIFGMNMVRKTTEGAKAANVARGMKNFLKSQERQLQYQGDKQLLFEKLLPFAVAFGVEKQWADRFKDVNLHEPDWYQGNYNGAFNSHVFASSLHNSVNSFATSATPVSSTTGSSSGFSGGSSGGGGGGGGGGSW